MKGTEAAHREIERWFCEALQAVDPRVSVRRALAWDGDVLRVGRRDVPIPPDARLIVVAIGKASAGMADGAAEVLGERIDRGIILTKEGYVDREVEGFEVREAAHPVPDERGLAATREIVDAVGGLSSRDLVLALISGGGSALLELPRDGISLADMQETVRLLMHAGAGIHDLNVVRQALSTVKGGGLRRAMGRARCVSLLLSDVLGNDPHVIASGPTVSLPAATVPTLDVMQRYGLEETVSPAVREALATHRSASLPDVTDDVIDVVADNTTLVREVARLASESGYQVCEHRTGYDGAAGALGRMLVEDTRRASPQIDALIGGGEATVKVAGSGRGGRNTEAALVAATAMEPEDGWVIASLASDGDDGNSGATGAIADPGTVERGRAAGADARAALKDNDSASFFRQAGGLVMTGPTGTNVNDVYIAVRLDKSRGQEV